MSANTTAVVFVHGLWMSGMEAFALRQHVLSQQGWQWHNFHYSSIGQHQDDVVAALDETVRGLDAERVHLVGHSLGGLVIHRSLLRAPLWPPGRVVFLGTPSLGSHAAERFRGLPLGDWFLGHAAEALLDTTPRIWSGPRELGIIAGNEAYSLGNVLTRFGEEANDGTVSVAETRLPGATAHLMLPVGHTGMLFSIEVAEQVCAFLESGHFRIDQSG
jgi:pimeloyl-ACP methyl ester carboxylesterase